MKQFTDVFKDNCSRRRNVVEMEHFSEIDAWLCAVENSKLRKEVEQQKAMILKLKTKKKMHKEDMHYI
jgi:hypothetical protein